ncbi:girdin-like isoform X2 [Leptopilina boulardi]|uniref:girdin-like isoform X2 n=1 Tax=Leptopilina boulardi TaxID=63433 RepID=UPI0021F66EC4|nr:girdin-like isoform X2 [Leptopilina boulardi]
MKDIRERQFVGKLDRYQLEDKYLRVLEEMENLKKLSNQQEDKMKRLTTKLMRVSANPSACINLHDICNDKEKISALECENNKLKNKVNVLRNQLLSQVNQRKSPKRNHKFLIGTPKNENGNTKLKNSLCQYFLQNNEEENIDKHLPKIQELETQTKEMTSRISELENELENRDKENQREKITDNIEHIRNLRYIKECTEQLVAFENENKSLKEEIVHVKKILNDTKRINKEMTSSLLIERKKITEMDLKIFKSKDSELFIREKDEQIQDLMNEIKILQQHNSELIALSNKYSNIEIENLQLTSKISDHVNSNEILKNMLNNEQANTIALQTANSQLLLKLNELQRNVDTLTIQLTTFEETSIKQKLTPKKINKEKYCFPQVCENVRIDSHVNKTIVNEKRDVKLGIEKESQTENNYFQQSQSPKKNILIQPRVEMENSTKIKSPERKKAEKMTKNTTTVQNGNNTLSPERMLKLLEQAQITTIPFETEKTHSMKQHVVDPISETIQKQRLNERKMDLEKTQFLSKHIVNYCTNIISFKDPNQILFLFTEILKNYKSLKYKNINDSNIEKKIIIDSNNNETKTTANDYCVKNENNIFQNGSEIFKSNLKDLMNADEEEKKKEESKCFCICDGRCPNYFYRQINEKYICCCTENSKNRKNICEPCSKSIIKVNEINTSIKETFHQKHNKVNETNKKHCGNYISKLLNNSILITKDQGLLEVHIVRLQLSKSAVSLLYQDNDLWKASFFISCDIENEKTSFTPTMNYPNLNFDSSSIFVVLEVSNFLHYIFEKFIMFRVHAFYQNQVTHTVAETKLCIREILDYPHNKMQYISSVTSVIPCSYGINFGYLSLWIRLGCDLNKIKTFKIERGIVSESIQNVINKSNQDSITKNFENREKNFQNHYLPFDTENNDNDEFMKVEEEEEKEKIKNSINGKVNQNSDEESKDSELDDEEESFSLHDQDKKLNYIIIELKSIKLFKESDIFLNPNIVQLYIEYSFLGYFGKEMETYSVPVPESPTLEMKYNFKKEFQIDEKNHSKQREILRKMLRGHIDPCIKFILVSEPLPEEQYKDCEEVGFAQLNLKDYVLGNYSRNMSLLIKNVNQSKNMGHLRITVDGIEAMKNCS